MNFKKLIKFSSLLMLSVSVLFLFEACTVDSCENVVCQNDGVCIDGDCECPDGFTGTECGFTLAESIVGDYTVLNSCVTGESYVSSIEVDTDYPSQNNRIKIRNPREAGETFFYPATITSATEINIPAFSLEVGGVVSSTTGTGEILTDGTIVLTTEHNGLQCTETLTPQ